MRQSSHILASAATLVIFAFCVTAKLATAEPALPPGFVELIIYEVPESTLTVGHGINDRRQVVGYFRSPPTGIHRQGFVREANGIFGGGGFGGGGAGGQFNVVTNSGCIAGSFGTDPQVDDPNHGVIFCPNGDVITFDVPGSIRTYPDGLNALGQASGYFDDSSGSHGFIRNPGFNPDDHRVCDGRGKAVQCPFITFDAPGSVGTFPGRINDRGLVTGSYNDADNNTHGFIRDAYGRFITFDVPGSVGTFPTDINNAGAVVGSFLTFDTEQDFRVHGFLHNSQGEFTIIDVPDARNTIPSGINNLGDISGAFDVGEEDGPPFVSGRPTYGFILIATPPKLVDNAQSSGE
jgi:hypothetical protein